MIRSNDIVNVIDEGIKAQVLDVDYFREENERFIVRIFPNDKVDFPRNIYASADNLSFVERPRF